MLDISPTVSDSQLTLEMIPRHLAANKITI